MTETRIHLPCLDEKGIDGRKIYNYRQWLERFKQYEKKHNIQIRQTIKERTITETDCNTKEEKIQKDFLWALRHKATHRITRSEYQTEPDKIKIDKLFNYKTDNTCRKETNTTHEEIFFRAKQSDTETLGDHCGELS